MFALAREIQKRRNRRNEGPRASTGAKGRVAAPVGPTADPNGPVVVEVAHLRKVYGDLPAVDDLTFSVRSGEVFSFLGPNGAGKSTTVEILEGLRDRTDGEVRVLGRDPWTDMGSTRERIGVVPQDFHFFPTLTPREAVQLYGRLFGVRVDAMELLEQVDLADKADDRYATLSGGQRQKVGVALALVNDPEVCFLDEPTTGLDPRARRSIWQVIRKLRAEGRTVFLTTHYLEEAQQLSDHIAIIDKGRLVATGTPEALIAKYGRPERLRIIGGPGLEAHLKALGLPAIGENGACEVELRSHDEAYRALAAMASDRDGWASFSTVSDTLEDVFIRLVGHLEDGTPRPAIAAGVVA
jgi:ABC-2 type transport system ATP-binding protein